MELDVPMVGSSHVVLGWKFPNFHADALFLPGQEEASWEYLYGAVAQSL